MINDPSSNIPPSNNFIFPSFFSISANTFLASIAHSPMQRSTFTIIMRYSRPAGNGNKYGIDVKASMIHTKPEVLVLRYDSVFTHKSSYYYKLPGN